MCWSLQVSVLFTLWGWSIGTYLIKRNVRWDRANGMWTLVVTSIQAADSLLWWDGMDTSGGTCSNTNWYVSFFLLPAILEAHCLVRQAEVRFSLLRRTFINVTAMAALGWLALPPAFGPAGSWDYTNTKGCSIPMAGTRGSPIWGGKEIPIFHFIMYVHLTAGPLWVSNRRPECMFCAALLALAFTFPGAYGSQWCSLCCVLTVKYLFHSGPRTLPLRGAKALSSEPSADPSSEESSPAKGARTGVAALDSLGAAARGAADAYAHWLYGSARMDAHRVALD